MSCSRVWHELWQNGNLLPDEAAKRIRDRKIPDQSDDANDDDGGGGVAATV